MQPIQAGNKGDLIHTVDGRVVSRQLCTSAYHFASILHWRAGEWDPFAVRTVIPLCRVKAHLALAANA